MPRPHAAAESPHRMGMRRQSHPHDPPQGHARLQNTMAKKCLDNWQYVERHRMASFTVAAGARADDVVSLAHCFEGDAAATLSQRHRHSGSSWLAYHRCPSKPWISATISMESESAGLAGPALGLLSAPEPPVPAVSGPVPEQLKYVKFSDQN